MSATTETRTATTETRNVGRIEEIQGVVIEAVFPDKLPEINHAITVKRPEAQARIEDVDIAAREEEYLVCEVQQHLGDDRVRTDLQSAG
jgi:F-type H+-transporting ATPase subunit beta